DAPDSNALGDEINNRKSQKRNEAKAKQDAEPPEFSARPFQDDVANDVGDRAVGMARCDHRIIPQGHAFDGDSAHAFFPASNASNAFVSTTREAAPINRGLGFRSRPRYRVRGTVVKSSSRP